MRLWTPSGELEKAINLHVSTYPPYHTPSNPSSPALGSHRALPEEWKEVRIPVPMETLIQE